MHAPRWNGQPPKETINPNTKNAHRGRENTPMRLTTPLESAMDYAEKGYKVFPLPCGKKAPRLKWKAAATNDPEQILSWWDRDPEQNIGIMGEQLFVLDVDVKKDANGDTNLAAFMEENGYTFPEDVFVLTTPSGGLHYYFRNPDMIDSAATGKPVKGCDIRAGQSGYVVGLGSYTEAGEYASLDFPGFTRRLLASQNRLLQT
jgi:hypothetical protein